MKAEKFIELIEQGRFDKISKNGMTLIAERFRQLQTKQLAIQGVVASLPNKKEMINQIKENYSKKIEDELNSFLKGNGVNDTPQGLITRHKS